MALLSPVPFQELLPSKPRGWWWDAVVLLLPYPSFANTQQKETISVFRLSSVLNITRKTGGIIRALLALFISVWSSVVSSRSHHAKTEGHQRLLVLIFWGSRVKCFVPKANIKKTKGGHIPWSHSQRPDFILICSKTRNINKVAPVWLHLESNL